MAGFNPGASPPPVSTPIRFTVFMIYRNDVWLRRSEYYFARMRFGLTIYPAADIDGGRKPDRPRSANEPACDDRDERRARDATPRYQPAPLRSARRVRVTPGPESAHHNPAPCCRRATSTADNA